MYSFLFLSAVGSSPLPHPLYEEAASPDSFLSLELFILHPSPLRCLNSMDSAVIQGIGAIVPSIRHVVGGGNQAGGNP